MFYICLETQTLLLDVLMFRRIALAKYPGENGFPAADGYISVPFFTNSKEIAKLAMHGRSALDGIEAKTKQSAQKLNTLIQKVTLYSLLYLFKG